MCGMTRKSFLTEGSAPQVTVPHLRLWAWTHKPSVNSSVGTLDVSSPSLWDFATNLPCVIGFVFPTPFSIFLPLENDSFVVQLSLQTVKACFALQHRWRDLEEVVLMNPSLPSQAFQPEEVGETGNETSQQITSHIKCCCC